MPERRRHSWIKSHRPLYWGPQRERREWHAPNMQRVRVCVNCGMLQRTHWRGYGRYPDVTFWMDDRKVGERLTPPCRPHPYDVRSEPDPVQVMSDDGCTA